MNGSTPDSDPQIPDRRADDGGICSRQPISRGPHPNRDIDVIIESRQTTVTDRSGNFNH